MYEDFIERLVNGVADFTNEAGEKPFIAAHIAAGHTIFNVTNVLLFLPFLKQLEKLVIFLVPDKSKKVKTTLELFGDISTVSPALALEQAYGELGRMAKLVDQVFVSTLKYLKASSEDRQLSEQVRKYENITDKMQMEITVFLGRVMEVRLTEAESKQVKAILRMADELESVADYCSSIINYSTRAYKEKFEFDQETKNEVYDLADKCQDLFNNVNSIVLNQSDIEIDDLKPIWENFNASADQIKELQLSRMAQGKFLPVASLTLSDIVVSFRRIKNHTVNLAEAYAASK